jgi:serine/threonine-protein kinase
MTKLTNGVAIDDQPEWTPDGKRVLYRSIEPSGTTLKSLPIDGSEAPTVVVNSKLDPYHGGLSRDGKWLITRTGDLAVPDRQIFVAPTSGDRTPRLLVKGPGSHFAPTLSPDDRLLAYVSDASGRPELYLRPFPESGDPIQVSRAGGLEPVWSRDGRTLFYRFGRAMMVVTVSSPPITISAPRVVFEGNYLSDGAFDNYDVAPDGKHFLMLQSVDRQAETIMVYRWADELRKAWR